MRSFTTQSHTVWDCKYHVVIVPKYRKKILYGHTRQRIGQIIRKLAEQRKIEILEGHAMIDHMHMVLRIPPRESVADVIGFLKGKSAIRAHYEFGKRKAPTQQKNFWSRGYFVSTVGIDEETIRNYVRNQDEQDKYEDGSPQLDLFWN
jgi:putative transposase